MFCSRPLTLTRPGTPGATCGEGRSGVTDSRSFPGASGRGNARKGWLVVCRRAVCGVGMCSGTVVVPRPGPVSEGGRRKAPKCVRKAHATDIPSGLFHPAPSVSAVPPLRLVCRTHQVAFLSLSDPHRSPLCPVHAEVKEFLDAKAAKASTRRGEQVVAIGGRQTGFAEGTCSSFTGGDWGGIGGDWGDWGDRSIVTCVEQSLPWRREVWSLRMEVDAIPSLACSQASAYVSL